jgi:prepilin-type N-terminal cleavage/methylation domain-containing protein
MTTNYQFKQSKQAGFTLIETMVSVAIFVIVAMVITTVFITIVDANRKAQSIRLVMDNLNFSLDSMALRMREGTNYNCESSDNNGCNRVSFHSASNNETVVFGLIDGQIGRCTGATVCNNLRPITAPQINIEQFTVNIDNQASKRAVMLIRGTAGAGRTLTSFSIQTSVAERN